MSMWQKLAALIGVREDQVEDALASTERARVQLSRRGLLLAGAALATDAILPGKRLISLPSAAWKNLGTVTGRFSMSDPVIQDLPRTLSPSMLAALWTQIPTVWAATGGNTE